MRIRMDTNLVWYWNLRVMILNKMKTLFIVQSVQYVTFSISSKSWNLFLFNYIFFFKSNPQEIPANLIRK